MTQERGLVHIYHGDGKGKTTAALGAALRAAGRGLRVTVARFMKNEDSGELALLRALPGVEVLRCTREFGFSWKMSEEERAEAAAYWGEMLERAFAQAARSAADVQEPGPGALLVLDEAVGACRLGFLDEKRLLALLAARPAALEVILTGRGPSPALLAAADYVTEMRLEKHPYERGIAARRGIEY